MKATGPVTENPREPGHPLSVGWLTFSPAYEGTILSLEEALIQAVKPKLNVKGQNPNRYR